MERLTPNRARGRRGGAPPGTRALVAFALAAVPAAAGILAGKETVGAWISVIAVCACALAAAVAAVVAFARSDTWFQRIRLAAAVAVLAAVDYFVVIVTLGVATGDYQG
jgi:hypothetical protein